MAIFEVYVPENAAPPARALNARFLKDRPSLLALIIPAVWLLWHRLWLAFAAWLVFAFCLAAIGATDYAAAAVAFSFLPGVFLFLEGPNLIADKWRSNGFQLVDLIEGDDLQSAELRWMTRQQLSAAPSSPGLPGPTTANQAQQIEDRPDFGLFAEE